MITRFAMIAVTLAAASITTGGVKPLDPNSEESLYQQISRLTRDDRRGGDAAVAAERDALPAQIDEKLAAIEQEVTRLRALGEPARARADSLAGRLGELRDRHTGKAVVNDARLELHVVGVYEGAPPAGAAEPTPAQRRRQPPGPMTAAVDVQATGRPIVLALCAYERVKWELRIADGANVAKLLVGGHHEQEVVGAPANIPVEKHRVFAYRKDADEYPAAMRHLSAMSGLEPCTFQGAYRPAAAPFVVGPGSADWVAQRMLIELEPAYREATAYTLAQRRAAVSDVRFKAIRFGPPVAGRLVAPAAAGIQVRIGGGSVASLADFTPLGPIDGTGVPLPGRANGAAFDPTDSTVYSLEMHGVFRIDPLTNRPVTLKPDDATLPEISWPSGLAFDTKRRRLVVSTRGGSGYLYAYDPATGRWSGLVDLENVDIHSLAYSAAHDCFYAVLMDMGEHRGPTRLVRYTPDGDADQLIETSRPLMMQRFRPDAVPQLIAVGEQLALIPPQPQRRPAPPAQAAAEPAPRPKCFLIDPKTGNVTYAGTMDAQPADRPLKLTDADIGAAWEQLSAEDPAVVDRAAARLVAAGDRAVAFVRAELMTNAEPIDPQHVKDWIAQLGDDDFTRRDAATRALRRRGREVEPALHDALKAGVSAEARLRIEGLLHEFAAPDDPGARQPDREGRAIELLGRIGSPGAVELLAELASGAAGVPRTVQARRAIDARRAIQEFARD